MPTTVQIKARITRRINASGLTLQVNYPAVRPAATGTAPGTGPISPLTGPVPTTVVLSPATVPAKASVSVACLWQQSYGSVATSARKDSINRLASAWLEGASALASVTVKDAALDITKPYDDTIFTGAECVEFQGKKYTILSVQPIGPSFADPYVYYVWVTGAAKQAA